eukprot:m.213439 g.213439  ORF g.213439 m.213439 type:complete len:306 (-) comp16955_c0_seq1:2664-3581(-)
MTLTDRRAAAMRKETGDLQLAFQAFRARRKEELALQRNPRTSSGTSTSTPLRTPAMKDKLRRRFVQQALKYLGVPYHRKYHQDPTSKHHNAPLYLDCCGLVRRVVRDLQVEFGFRLGGGNQAYQFDTLPIALKREEMKPGDLVFISGTYYNENSKRQKHDMVHVEIWLGEGEKTIGARYQHGVLQIHDSYKFVSKSYYDMKFHFRSIDTWLDGVCQSFCSEHDWKPTKSAAIVPPSKFSIFRDRSNVRTAASRPMSNSCCSTKCENGEDVTGGAEQSKGVEDNECRGAEQDELEAASQATSDMQI